MAGETDIPVEVRELVARSIGTVEHLEILLLLRTEPARSWTAKAVAAELRTSEASADMRLQDLCATGLLDVRIGNQLHFRYGPITARLDHLVEQLAHEYKERRVAVTALIFSRPGPVAQDLGDPLRRKRKKSDDD